MKSVVLHSKDYLRSDEEIRIFPDEIEDFHSAHAHEFVEIVYIASGSGTQRIGNHEETVSKGDLFVINANVVHDYRVNPKASKLLIYNCIFEPLFIDSSFRNCKNFIGVAFNYVFHTLFDDDPKNYIKLSGVQHGKIDTLLNEMLEEFNEKQSGYRHILKTDLTKLMIYIFRVFKNDATQKQDVNEYKKLIVHNAIAYIKDHYSEKIKCDQLARQAYISTGYFNKIFKEISGMTVIETLQNIRVNVACDMLETTDKTVEAIAYEVGYSDIKFFYQLFKRKKSMTPMEYRKKYGKE